VPLEISSSHNGQTVSLKVGDTVDLRLPENPSTGYRWTIDTLDPAHVKISETGFRGTDSVGGGGDAYWRLRGAAAGETALTLKRWRSFEGDRSVVERFAVTLQITD
jgi:inhibitor of cysteine peptidase